MEHLRPVSSANSSVLLIARRKEEGNDLTIRCTCAIPLLMSIPTSLLFVSFSSLEDDSHFEGLTQIPPQHC